MKNLFDIKDKVVVITGGTGHHHPVARDRPRHHARVARRWFRAVGFRAVDFALSPFVLLVSYRWLRDAARDVCADPNQPRCSGNSCAGSCAGRLADTEMGPTSGTTGERENYKNHVKCDNQRNNYHIDREFHRTIHIIAH